MIVGRSPLRISFAGGGTDLEEYYKRYTGHTISFTISKNTHVVIQKREDEKFQGFSPDFQTHHPPEKYSKVRKNLQGHEIIIAVLKELNVTKGINAFFCSDVNAGSGLGASSSLATNLVNTVLFMEEQKWTKKRIAEKAYEIAHNVLKWNLGKQDEFSSSYGGLNLFEFTKDNVKTERLLLNKSTFREIQDNSLLFSLERKRQPSSTILKDQAEKTKKNDPRTINALHNTNQFALELRDCLKRNDLTAFSEILRKGWDEKRNSHARLQISQLMMWLNVQRP